MLALGQAPVGGGEGRVVQGVPVTGSCLGVWGPWLVGSGLAAPPTSAPGFP